MRLAKPIHLSADFSYLFTNNVRSGSKKDWSIKAYLHFTNNMLKQASQSMTLFV